MAQPAPSGLIIIDKPQGVTSFDAVAAVRGALHIKKVGHAGTLDPMATGALVIAFGHATRLLNAIVEHDKTYEATIRLGLGTTTDDAEGELDVTSGEGARTVTGVTQDEIRAAIADHFTGDIEQVPNTFSAIKINGKRAYDLAREGKDVELKARPVHISEFAVLAVRQGYVAGERAGELLREAVDWHATADSSGPTTSAVPIAVAASSAPPIPVLDVDVRVSCSSGTYIRALARDLGAELGVGGHLIRLHRTRVGRFALPDDTSGLIGDEAMAATRDHTVTAHSESKTFTNRDGETVTRNKCVLDTPAELSGEERREWLLGRALTMEQAARGAMPALDITPDEAAELRFGRRIERVIGEPTVAIVPQTHDVVAILERANVHQAKPATVFPAE
ncbi:tRNA pseudouridine(55) synthase TruB [Bifidobacterium sp. SO4]|uniref:tRNA pseudouridine(55) synthase TruB n=1 Tax=Bifidobacterium sp. SO4 TaxID=2809030 RepID=UPI001BDC7881|nr:tRNA pseudouridine(55) synthase TruB [Bifidobacterium sp. SO4]MBT1170847.1 tRNA pseudouridine(55) synthase TruB [Bifidobacterium sp. SO4]